MAHPQSTRPRGRWAHNGTLAERIWRRIDRSGGPDACWPWIGPRDAKGYGRLSCLRVHREVWKLVNGPIPPGMHVLHNCPGGDNPPCCNPHHLWLGTTQQNSADMVAKERQARGPAFGRAISLGKARARAARFR